MSIGYTECQSCGLKKPEFLDKNGLCELCRDKPNGAINEESL